MSIEYKDYNASALCSFKIGGKIKTALFPETLEEFAALLRGGDYDYILGNCTNILFSSSDINKTIIFTDKLNNIEIQGSRVRVQCGAKGAAASRMCRDKELSGFEFLIGLPGSFGGMVCMNASAHNQAVSGCFISAEIFDAESKKIITLKKNELNFRYRGSDIEKKHYIVLSAEFELKRDNYSSINEKMQKNIEFRKQHQPLLYPNAGSIFKNPAGNSAGALLDLCGVKGLKEGGAEVFQNHANFIINKNNADSKDVLILMHKMFSKVKEKYKIELKPEIKYIGDEGAGLKSDREACGAELWKQLTENLD